MVGWVDFIPPELLSDGEVNDKSIVWSLGVLLYILLGGNPDQLEQNKTLFNNQIWSVVSVDAKNLI